MINPTLRVGFAFLALGLVGGTYGLVFQYKGNSKSQSLISSIDESDQGISSLNPSGDRGKGEFEEEGLQNMGGDNSGRATENPSLNVLTSDSELKDLSGEKTTTISTESTNLAEKIPLSVDEPAETGKCKVLATSANILRSVIVNKQDYYTIFCDNGEIGDDSLPPIWTALFPKSIFKEEIQFKVDQQLNIDLHTDMEQDVSMYEEILGDGDLRDVDQWYEMKATSNKFSTKTITGFWGYKTFDDENSGIIIVLNDTNIDQEIYMLLQPED